MVFYTICLLDFKDMISSGQVCRRWRDIVYQSAMFKLQHKRFFGCDDSFYEKGGAGAGADNYVNLFQRDYGELMQVCHESPLKIGIRDTGSFSDLSSEVRHPLSLSLTIH